MWKLHLIGIMVILSCANQSTEVSAQDKAKSTASMIDALPEQPARDSMYQGYDFDMLMGHFDPAKHVDYVLIDASYADRAGMYLHKDTYKAFITMHAAAEKDGVELTIRSATRNFDYQKGIWERKWTGETIVRGKNLAESVPNPEARALEILQYSSMPGTSRHHWGSDIDLNSFSNEWFETGEGRRLWDWLEANGAKYGFCRPYTARNELRPHGYQEERWHWSYMPLSSFFMSMAKEKHSDTEIKGFMGAEVADKIDVVEKYVFGVNGECWE